METKLLTIAFIGTLIACGSKQNEGVDNSITGIYVREYVFDVNNPELGGTLGSRTVRDSIFLRETGELIEVTNHKWQKNSYDDKGWKDMRHSNDRPLAKFTGSLDKDSHVIEPKGPGERVTLQPGNLYVGENKEHLYSLIAK